MVIDENYNHSLYKIVDETNINRKKVIILILLVFILIVLLLTAKNSIHIIREYKVYEQYETQLLVLQKQEEEKQAEIERKRQEKIPKLTQKRKR